MHPTLGLANEEVSYATGRQAYSYLRVDITCNSRFPSHGAATSIELLPSACGARFVEPWFSGCDATHEQKNNKRTTLHAVRCLGIVVSSSRCTMN